jgi:hypothetical protein
MHIEATAVDTKSSWMIRAHSGIARDLITQNLINFSQKILLEKKLITRNSKTGFDFIRQGGSQKSTLRRIEKLLISRIEKDIPYMVSEPMIHRYASTELFSCLSLMVLDDPAVYRYVRSLNRKLIVKEIPLIINIGSARDMLSTTVLIEFVGGSRDYMKLYTLLFDIEDCLTVLKTLHRKALYADASSRNHTTPTYIDERDLPDTGRSPESGGIPPGV